MLLIQCFPKYKTFLGCFPFNKSVKILNITEIILEILIAFLVVYDRLILFFVFLPYNISIIIYIISLIFLCIGIKKSKFSYMNQFIYAGFLTMFIRTLYAIFGFCLILSALFSDNEKRLADTDYLPIDILTILLPFIFIFYMIYIIEFILYITFCSYVRQASENNLNEKQKQEIFVNNKEESIKNKESKTFESQDIILEVNKSKE